MSTPSSQPPEIFLKKNLRHLRERNGKISQGKLAEAIGITRSAISSYEDGRAEPKLQVLNAIAEYFNITVDQLLNMPLAKLEDSELQRQIEVKKYASAANLRVLSITVDENDAEYVDLVPEKAAAGYTNGYAHPEYLEALPKYRLPFLSKGRTYRAFEIVGESMLPIQPNSIIIGAYLEDFHTVKNGQVCIVVTDDGIVLKKVFNRIEKRGTLLLKSSNILYQPYEVPVENVREVWAFTAYISRTLPDQQTDVQDLRNAFNRLEEDVMDIKANIDNNNRSYLP